MLSVDSGMPNEEIKAMSTDVLSGLGFASWVSGTLNGSSMPLPVGVVNTLPDTSSPSVWNGTDVDTDLRTNEDGSAYYIDSAAELAGFVQLVNGGTNYFAGKTVYLTTDIVWNEDNDGYLNWTATKGPANKWTPIGTYTANHFQGTFDGLGHTVSGLYAPAVSVGSGFFGVIRKGAITIRNLSVVNSFFSSGGGAGAIVGAIAGGNPTSVIIENVYASAQIISTGRGAGGIYGSSWSASTVPVTISNAVFEGSVTNTGTSNCSIYIE
jgi:hypothetical protein